MLKKIKRLFPNRVNMVKHDVHGYTFYSIKKWNGKYLDLVDLKRDQPHIHWWAPGADFIKDTRSENFEVVFEIYCLLSKHGIRKGLKIFKEQRTTDRVLTIEEIAAERLRNSK